MFERQTFACKGTIAAMQEENTDRDGQTQASLFRAAEYVRMSTEHQQYSTENQADKIREYAARRGIEIIKTYADAGKSGLRIDGRQALQQLIKDVETGAADFQIILVYDVSRWGRFQDADESAYYEYICRRAGIQVAYCAEQFENDGSPPSPCASTMLIRLLRITTCCHGWISDNPASAWPTRTRSSSTAIGSRPSNTSTAWPHAQNSGGLHDTQAPHQRSPNDSHRPDRRPESA